MDLRALDGRTALDLARYASLAGASQPADGGAAWSPPDRLPVETRLRAFELPWDGTGQSSVPQRYAAVSAPAGRWGGAMLYRESADTLVPIGHSGPQRAVGGILAEALPPSPGLRFDATARVRVRLDDYEAALEPAGLDAIARGSNRLLIGGEIVQFAQCQLEGNGIWQLCGLLRGRGGTEIEAQSLEIGGDGKILQVDKDVNPSMAGQDLVADLRALGVS